jgi:hypothetical protein
MVKHNLWVISRGLFPCPSWSGLKRELIAGMDQTMGKQRKFLEAFSSSPIKFHSGPATPPQCRLDTHKHIKSSSFFYFSKCLTKEIEQVWRATNKRNIQS